MSVICLASLKGGVGKTSLSINISHAFAERGCETLLIDCDPTAHTTRFFRRNYHGTPAFPNESPLARLFLANDGSDESVVDAALSGEAQTKVNVRRLLDLIPGGHELRHFMWGRGAQFFSRHFANLISELKSHYDYIVIDTAPDYSVVTRNAIAVSDIVVGPVDSSEMSLYCLGEIIANAAHIKGPQWVILRSMVNRQASRIQAVTLNHIRENFNLTDEEGGDMEDSEKFIECLRERVRESTTHASIEDERNKPIYLLNSLVYRSEQQNRLSFLGKTAFDMRSTSKLAAQYLQVAKELEEVVSLTSESPTPPTNFDKYIAESLQA